MTLFKKAKKLLSVTLAAALAVLVIPVFAGKTNAAGLYCVALLNNGTIEDNILFYGWNHTDHDNVVAIIPHIDQEQDRSRFKDKISIDKDNKIVTFKDFSEEHYEIEVGVDGWTFIFDGVNKVKKITINGTKKADALLLVDVTQGSSVMTQFVKDGNDTKVMLSEGVEYEGDTVYTDDAITFSRPIPSYEITDGDKQSVEVKSGQSLTFVCNGDLGKLKSVIVDDKNITEKGEEAFTLELGSTKITLKAEFLDTLEGTDHTLTLEYIDGGKATASFTITKSEKKAPQTGQGMDMMLFIFALCLVSGGVIYFKKARNI